MTIAMISASSFVLGATVAYVANRYPGYREAIDAVGGALLIGWALLSSLLDGRDTGRRSRPERNRSTTTRPWPNGDSVLPGVTRGTAAPSGRC
jgi:hypothetical protein